MSLLVTILGILLLLATVVTIIYLIGRIDLLETFISLRLAASPSAEPEKGGSTDKSFLGLESKALWDALSGSSTGAVSEEDLNGVRNRYATLLKKHISTLYTAGLNDGKKGESRRKPANPMAIATLRGTLNAWLPQQHVSNLYSVGYESARATPVDLDRLLSSLTETIELLYLRSGLTMEPDFPHSLLGLASSSPAPDPDSKALSQPTDQLPPPQYLDP